MIIGIDQEEGTDRQNDPAGQRAGAGGIVRTEKGAGENRLVARLDRPEGQRPGRGSRTKGLSFAGAAAHGPL